MSPKLLKTGKEAVATVATILPTAHTMTVNSSLGEVELKPGTIWGGNKLLFYAAPMYVWYCIDDRIYEWGTGAFVRDEWLNALSEGASRASHMIVIAKVEFALMAGIFVPWYVLLGMSCAKAGVFYATNKTAIEAARKHAPKVMSLLRDLRSRAPALFSKLMSTAAREILVNLPSGVSAEDVAFFLGRAIRGAAGAGPDMTFGALLKIVSTVAALVVGTHLPSIAAHGMAHAAATHTAELRRRMQAAGYTVTEPEARTILSELMRDPVTPQKLQELEKACQALLPTLEVLKKAYLATD